jgi:hypothetical protein
MSITTSNQERQEAVEKLADRSDEQLRDDLAYWAVTTGEHQQEFQKVSEQRLAVLELHNEAQAWVSLITQELMVRRVRGRETAS